MIYINDSKELGRSICEIYPKELQLKVGNQGDHAAFLNLDITIEKETFIYKLFDKIKSFLFSILRMAHTENNIPPSIFYLAIKIEFLKNVLQLYA